MHRGEHVHNLPRSLGNRLHIQRVANQQPGIAELFAQQVVHHRARKGRRQVGPPRQRRRGDVGGHQQARSGRDGGANRPQLNRIQPRARKRERRQSKVGVHVRLAVAGKMFGRGRHAGRLQAADQRRAQFRRQRRIVAEGAHAHVGVARIGVHVADGAVVHVHAQRRHFRAERLPHAEGQVRVARRAQGHVARKLGHAVAQGHELAALLVGCNQQGGVGGDGRLQRRRQRPGLGRIAHVARAEKSQPGIRPCAQRGQKRRRRGQAVERQHQFGGNEIDHVYPIYQ